jgi:chemotaxis protein MotB
VALAAGIAHAEVPPEVKVMRKYGSGPIGERKMKDLVGKRAADEKQMQAKLADLEAALASTQQSVAGTKMTLEQRAAQLERENALLKKQLATLGSSSEELRRRVELLKIAEEQAEKRAQQFRDMVAKFKQMIDAGRLQVEFRNGMMIVKLPDNILFDPGKTQLKRAGQEAITQVAQILQGIADRKFQVTGHTDNVPIKSKRFKSNWELSSARAVEVLKVMIAAGMDPQRLSAAGYADTLPVASNADAVGRLQNRRIEIVMQPNLDELPQFDLTKPADAASPATPPAK